METIRKRRRSSSSRSSLEREYSNNTSNRNERSLERRRSSTWSYADNPIKNCKSTRRQNNISPSRNKRNSSLHEARKSFSSRHNQGCSSSSRRERSAPSPSDINTLNIKERNSSPELCKREWLPSSNHEDNHHSLGYSKTRRATYDSSSDSSDFDTPVKKNMKTKRERESFSPKKKSRSYLSEHGERISSRKQKKHAFVYKNDPEIMSQQYASYSSMSDRKNSMKHKRKDSNERRSSSSTCTASSTEIRSPSPYRSYRSSTLSGRESSVENQQRTRSTTSPKKSSLSRPSEKIRSPRSSGRKCFPTEKKRYSGSKNTAASSSTEENSPSLMWSDGQSPVSDKQPKSESDISTSIRTRSTTSPKKSSVSRPSEKIRSPRSSRRKCFSTEKKRYSGSKNTAASSSTEENSPSLMWSDGQSPVSDKQPKSETDMSTSIRRTQSPPVSVKDTGSPLENSDRQTRKRKFRKWNRKSTSSLNRDSNVKDSKESGDWTWPLVYKRHSRSASPIDKDRHNRDNIDTKDGRGNFSNRTLKLKDSAVKNQGNISYATPQGNKRDEDYMKIQVVVNRRRSSDTSYSNITHEYTDTRDAENARKRRRLNEFDSRNQTDSDKILTKSNVRSVAMNPKSYPQDIHRGGNPVDDYEFGAGGHSSYNKRRSFHDDHLSHNCCSHSDETGDSYRERSGGYGGNAYSPASGRKNSFGSASGRTNVSPLIRTPQRSSGQYFEGSPRFSSPSFISNLTPRSTLRGLDQPHPWAQDLTARSRTYSSNFIDSHCHIDLIYDRIGLSHGTTFSEFRRMVAHSFPVNFEGCVAVFCYPKTYDPNNPQDQLFSTLAHDDGVWFAIGCHPKSATEFTARHEQGLRKALKQSKVVALGEIGLDYSGTFYRHAETQKKVLRKQLEMAVEMKLPLVLHCRDAYDDCLAILKEIVPRSWPIHLHCFCGNPDTANEWLETYPNLYIGLTPVITYKTAHDAMNTARIIPLSRLLLETDSPYFVPGNIPKGRSSVSHPGFALFTAERIAELKNVSVDTVLDACRANTYNVYGI